MPLRVARALCIAALVAVALVAALVARPILPVGERGRSEASPAAGRPAHSTAERPDKTPPRAASAGRTGDRGGEKRGSRNPRIHWRRSVAIGLPEAGSLVHGVLLSPEGVHYFTWDPILKRRPNRASRRWGTDDPQRLLRAHRLRDVESDRRQVLDQRDVPRSAGRLSGGC